MSAVLATSWWNRMVTSMPIRAEIARKRPDNTNSTSRIVKAVMAKPEATSSQKVRGGRPCSQLSMSGATVVAK